MVVIFKNNDYTDISVMFGLFRLTWYDALAMATVCGFEVYFRAGSRAKCLGIEYEL